MGKKHEQDLRIVQGVVDAQLAERDAEIEQLRQQVDAWQATGDAIMQCAVGREAPLSDSDVCGEINALRQQVAELQAQIAAVKRKAQKFGDIADDWQKLANEKPEDSPKSGGFARISSVYAVCAAELREVIGIE